MYEPKHLDSKPPVQCTCGMGNRNSALQHVTECPRNQEAVRRLHITNPELATLKTALKARHRTGNIRMIRKAAPDDDAA